MIAFLPGGIWPRIVRFVRFYTFRLMLQVRTLTKAFRGLVAVRDVSFDVADNEIVALIGPNGAGKTTCFNMIAGALRPTAGSVMLDGEIITGLPPEQIAMKGLVRTFQIVRPMRTMTVLENAMIGAFARTADVNQASDIASRCHRPGRPAEQSTRSCRQPDAAGPQNA